MGRGNNFGISLVKTEYVLILNPDVILEPNTIDELILASKTYSNFSILSPISDNSLYPNYKLAEKNKSEKNENLPFLVNDGTITMDFTLKQKTLTTVRDHGYLFKLWPESFGALFQGIFTALGFLKVLENSSVFKGMINFLRPSILNFTLFCRILQNVAIYA